MGFRISKDDAMMSAIGLLDGPNLYDPRIKGISGHELTIVGIEKEDFSWHLQEWKCELIKLHVDGDL